MKLILTLFLILTATGYSFCLGKTKVTVIDALTEEPIKNVTIVIEYSGESFKSGDSFEFYLDKSLVGEELSYFKDGYEGSIGKRLLKKDNTIILRPVADSMEAFFNSFRIKEEARRNIILSTIDTNSQVLKEDVDCIEEVDGTFEAEFPGGASVMQRFIANFIDYPVEALEMGDQGRVYLAFIIELDGSISEIKVMRGVTEELDNEAKNLIRLMPKWLPGYCNGRPVRTRVSLPINFALE